MSYDVVVGPDWYNYTSNMSRFFRDFDVYPPDWDGRDRFEVADKIDHALESISVNRIETLKAEYDTPNDWGHMETAIEFLKKVRDSCRREIPQKVSVSW